jgi:hypothetical protein
MAELRELGRSKPAEAVPPKPDDYSTIMYTSGTTGTVVFLGAQSPGVGAQIFGCFPRRTKSGGWGPNYSIGGAKLEVHGLVTASEVSHSPCF